MARLAVLPQPGRSPAPQQRPDWTPWEGLFAIDTVRQAGADDATARPGDPDRRNADRDGRGGVVARHLAAVVGKTVGHAVCQALRLGAYLFLCTFAAGLAAGIIGYVRLAHLFTAGIIAGGIMALALYTSVRLVSGVLAFALRAAAAGTAHGSAPSRPPGAPLYRLLVWAAIISWVGRYLNYVGLWEPVLSLGQAVLAARLERGAIHTSWATSWPSCSRYCWPTCSRPSSASCSTRTCIPTCGSPQVSPTLLRACCITSPWPLACGRHRAAGGEPDHRDRPGWRVRRRHWLRLAKHREYFVSGLILLFERPIHVGDTVELGELQGVVRRIGIRASVVHTLQGADIIVPNAQLVTEKVTNWTFTDQLRRIDLPVSDELWCSTPKSHRVARNGSQRPPAGVAGATTSGPLHGLWR